MRFFTTLLICWLFHQEQLVGQRIESKASGRLDTGHLPQDCIIDKTQLGNVFTRLEIPAEFPGGFEKWMDYTNKNFEFEDVLQSMNDSIRQFQDSIILKFIVLRNGSICNIEVLKGNLILRGPAIRLLKDSPAWRPGVNGGRLLNSYRTLRIDIFIDKKENTRGVMRYFNSYFRSNDKDTD